MSEEIISIEKVQQAIASIRPALQSDGGDLQLVSIEGDTVRVKLEGACLGCHLAAHTLGGIRRHLSEELGRPIRVLPGA